MPAAVLAQDAGRVLFAHGEVSITRGEEAGIKVRRGDRFSVGDQFKTGKDGSAQLRFTDGALVALQAGSQLVIEKHSYNEAEPKKGEQAVELLRGGLRAITGVIGKENPEAVSYRTPVATIGIRGTVYEVIYVPPEGLPGLPGVAPGQYTMVLRGRVALTSGGGELALGAGEIGYVASAESVPVLRPDLYTVFATYLTQTEGEGQTGETTQGDAADGEVNTVTTELAVVQTVKTTYGPFALLATASGTTPYKSAFVTNAVTLDSSGALTSASSGTGDVSSFSFTGTTPTVSGSATVGTSTVYWGAYSTGEVSLLDPGAQPLTVSDNIHYIDATNVLLKTSDLPTTGTQTYNYAGGTGTMLLDATSKLVVDFAQSTIDITLNASADTWQATGQAISAFYGSGVTVPNVGSGFNATIGGRFVGTNAEGAITNYTLDYSDAMYTGTALFKAP